MNATSGVTLAEWNIEFKDINDWHPCFAVVAEAFGASPVEQTYKIQFSSESGGNTTNIKEARIFALELDAADQYAESAALETSPAGDNTPQSKATLAFAPGTAGDYLVLASADLNADSGISPQARITTDGAASATWTAALKDPLNYYPFGYVDVKALTAAAHTIDLQFSSDSATGQARIRNARVLALRLDKFLAAFTATAAAAQTTAAGTYQDVVTASGTANAADHLVVGGGWRSHSSTTTSAMTRIAEDGAAILGEAREEAHETNLDLDMFPAAIFMARRTLSAGAHDWTVQYHGNGSNTRIREAAIAAIELG